MVKRVIEGWVPVSEIRGSIGYGLASDQEWAEQYGVELVYDWRGRAMVAAKDAARILAEESARDDDARLRMEAFDAYESKFWQARQVAAALAGEIIYRQASGHAFDQLRARGTRRIMSMTRNGVSWVDRDQYDGGAAAISARREHARQAVEVFDRDNSALGFGEWLDAGMPDTPIADPVKAAARAVAEVTGETMKSIEAQIRERKWLA